MTLVALTVATASMPGSSPIWSAASRVMNASTRCGPAWISTVAASPSRFTSVITPGKRFLALACGDRFLVPAFGEQARDLRGGHGALAALGALDAQLAVAFPAAQRLDTHAERLRGFADAIGVGHRSAGYPVAPSPSPGISANALTGLDSPSTEG